MINLLINKTVTTKISFVSSFGWTRKTVAYGEIIFAGLFWYKNNYYVADNACLKLCKIFNKRLSESSVIELVSHLTGHFCFIVKNDKYTLIFVDKIRSFPLYYTFKGHIVHISNSAIVLRDTYNLSDMASLSLLEFKMAGYTLGNKTLYKQLYQLQAGELLFADHETGKVNKCRHFRYFGEISNQKNENELIDELHKATITTFSKMVATCDGRPIFIPLSGGLDSRLILAMLLQMKYDNIFTYTYGHGGVWEIKRAQYITNKLNVNWKHVEFNSKTKKYYNTIDRKNYWKFASGLNSAPHLAEYYALLHLKEEHLIPEEAIIINGQSGDFTSGGHVPVFISSLNQNEKVPVSKLSDSLIKKHFSLWANIKTPENLSLITGIILSQLKLKANGNLSLDDFARYYELFECEERQCKYVINGQRAYEWLNFDWRLPFWSDELIDFWVQVPWQFKINQKLLLNYLITYNFQDLFNTKLPRQYSYYPFWMNLLKPGIYLLNKITNKGIEFYNIKYFKYFMTYASLYPRLSYLQYLKDSKFHRNYISYTSKDFLKEIISSETNNI